MASTLIAPEPGNGFTPPNPLFEAVVRRWKYWLIALVSAAGLGFLSAKPLATTTWTFVGSLLYQPSQAGAPFYLPPDVQTLVALFKSPALLEPVAKQLDPPMAPAALGATLRAEVPFGAQSISLKIESNSPERACRCLERIMAAFIDQVQHARDAALATVVDDLRSSYQRSLERLDREMTALRAFQSEHRFVDLERELSRLEQEIGELARSLEVASDSPHLTRTDAGNEERVALRELLQDERETIAAQAQLELKRNEVSRAEALHARRFISDAEIERLRTEFRALEGQTSGLVRQYRDKLQKINTQAMNGETPADATSGMAAALAQERERRGAYLADRRAELARLAPLRGRNDELLESVRAATAERQRLESLLATFEQLHASRAADVTVMQPPLPSLDPPKSSFKKLWFMHAMGWFMVLAGPMLIFELCSDRRTRAEQVAGSWGFPLITQGLIPTRPLLPEQLARRWNLPMLRRGSAQTSGSNDFPPRDDIRRLALRLQQAVAPGGGAILWSSLGETPIDPRLIFDVAGCLAQRGERVVIVDLEGHPNHLDFWDAHVLPTDDVPEGANARLTLDPESLEKLEPDVDREGGVATRSVVCTRTSAQSLGASVLYHPRRGLSDYLALPWCQPEEVLRSTDVAGVDCVLPGTGPRSPEALATRRASEWFEALKRRYSLVLILGPDARQDVDLAMLAARVEGIVWCATDRRAPDRKTQSVVADLCQLGVPVVGIVG